MLPILTFYFLFPTTTSDDINLSSEKKKDSKHENTKDATPKCPTKPKLRFAF